MEHNLGLHFCNTLALRTQVALPAIALEQNILKENEGLAL